MEFSDKDSSPSGGGDVKLSRKLFEALAQNTMMLQRVLMTSQRQLSDTFFPYIGANGTGDGGSGNGELGEVDPRQAAIEKELDDRAFEGLVNITLFALFCMLIMSVYIGIVWLNFDMIYGYPSIGVPPSPGPFVNQRYTPMYFFVWILAFNLIPPIALMIAANTPNKISGLFFHRVVTILAFLINIVSPLVLWIMYWVFCNGSNAYRSVLANDVFWCCVHFAARPIECPIAMTGCVMGAPMTRAELMLPLEYLLTILLGILFFFLTWGHLQLNASFGPWGLWRTAL